VGDSKNALRLGDADGQGFADYRRTAMRPAPAATRRSPCCTLLSSEIFRIMISSHIDPLVYHAACLRKSDA
jgi:hypothetical protein